MKTTVTHISEVGFSCVVETPHVASGQINVEVSSLSALVKKFKKQNKLQSEQSSLQKS